MSFEDIIKCYIKKKQNYFIREKKNISLVLDLAQIVIH
jgi:hypothetical protein